MIEEPGRLVAEGGDLAWRRVRGVGPTVIWLGGYRSDMTGTKAQALAEWAQAGRRSYLRFDFTAHGQSSGDFDRDGTITRWRADALAVIDRLTEGAVVLVGSSMGGWIATLAALARPERVAGLVLVAPAPDYTSALVEPALTAQQREALDRDGAFQTADGSRYSRALIEDGARWTLLPGPVDLHMPVRILQGGCDEAVPWRHALALAEAFAGDDVAFTLVRDGDHRLSRPQDIARLIAAVDEVAAP